MDHNAIVADDDGNDYDDGYDKSHCDVDDRDDDDDDDDDSYDDDDDDDDGDDDDNRDFDDSDDALMHNDEDDNDSHDENFPFQITIMLMLLFSLRLQVSLLGLILDMFGEAIDCNGLEKELVS